MALKQHLQHLATLSSTAAATTSTGTKRKASADSGYSNSSSSRYASSNGSSSDTHAAASAACGVQEHWPDDDDLTNMPYCMKCAQDKLGEDLLSCAYCPRTFHVVCLGIAKEKVAALPDDWKCPRCYGTKNGALFPPSNPVSQWR